MKKYKLFKICEGHKKLIATAETIEEINYEYLKAEKESECDGSFTYSFLSIEK